MPERHVIPDRDMGGGWKVTSAGETELHTTTQPEAIEKAMEHLARDGGGELFVHGVDGSLREIRTVKPQPSQQ
jgi:hypothetical protein